jgi:hypothetical protein
VATVGRVVSEALAADLAAERMVDFSRRATEDLASFSHHPTWSLFNTHEATERVTASDYAARVAFMSRAVANIISTADAASQSHPVDRTASDALTVADVVTDVAESFWGRGVSEHPLADDDATRLLEASRSSIDAPRTRDSALNGSAAPRSQIVIVGY